MFNNWCFYASVLVMDIIQMICTALGFWYCGIGGHVHLASDLQRWHAKLLTSIIDHQLYLLLIDNAKRFATIECIKLTSDAADAVINYFAGKKSERNAKWLWKRICEQEIGKLVQGTWYGNSLHCTIFTFTEWHCQPNKLNTCWTILSNDNCQWSSRISLGVLGPAHHLSLKLIIYQTLVEIYAV